MDTTTSRIEPGDHVGNERPPATRRAVVAAVAGVAAALLSTTACGSGAASPVTASTPTTIAISVSTTTTSPTAPVPPTTVAPRPIAEIDELVGGDGERIHVRCVGQGDITVLLISGFGGDASGWTAVEPTIAAEARVCSYDRPGTGTSDPARATTTFRTQAADLHALLATIGEPGPYVVTGHSFGGPQAVTFASMFAEEVTGLVLVDASPTTWPAELCAVPDDGSDAAAIVRSICDGFSPARNSEQLDVVAAFHEASAITSVGSLPTAVITARDRELPPGLAATEVQRLTEAWNQGQADWTALSTAAHLVTVDDTSHHIEIDRPGVVIDEILRLVR